MGGVMFTGSCADPTVVYEVDGTITVTVDGDSFVLTIGAIPIPPEYADDVAADADGGLPSGGLYTVTGLREIRVKP